MPTIYLQSGNTFDSDDLVKYIKTTERNYIIRGPHKDCTFENHPQKSSLDYWLRVNYAQNPDIKQASNDIITQLLRTGAFDLGKFPCPDSLYKKLCKGLAIGK